MVSQKHRRTFVNTSKTKEQTQKPFLSNPRPEKMAWHGSSGAGLRHVDSFCEGWRDQAVSGMASSLRSGSLLQQSPSGCASSFAVLCIENSYIGHAKR